MDEEIKSKMTKTGTTTVGIVCKDGIVLATDKKATMGNFIGHKKVDKVFTITDKIALTTAGNVSDVQYLLKLIRAELKLKQLRTKLESNVKATANLLGTLAYENIRKFSPIMAITAFIVGGVDNKGFWLFQVDPDGTVLRHEDYVSYGSGSVFAYGLFENEYKESLSLDEGIKLAIKAVNTAMQRDVMSGEGIDVVIIDKKGARKIFEAEIKHVIVEKNKSK